MGLKPKKERVIGPSRRIRGREGRVFEKVGGIFGNDSAMITKRCPIKLSIMPIKIFLF
jgi:hypothetical protein